MTPANSNSSPAVGESTVAVATNFSYLDVAIYSLIVLVPLLLSGPQLVIGSIVNACLFMAAEYWPMKKLVPLAILPSLAAIMHGIVLGPFTPFLIYMAPAIWLSNGLLMLVYKHAQSRLGVIGIGLSALVKAAFLFAIAWLLVGQQVLPSIFLRSMGIFQLITALMGGLGFFLTNRVMKNYARN